MNQELRAQHFETITNPCAMQMYDRLCAACEMREGGMTDADQMLVADIARAEQIKQALLRISPIGGSARSAATADKNTGRKTAA